MSRGLFFPGMKAPDYCGGCIAAAASALAFLSKHTKGEDKDAKP